MLIPPLQKNGRWEESIALSKHDKLYKDAMVTAAASVTTEVSEDLLTYFVDIGNKECFAAMLYICFDLLREDIVEELSWQHGLNDFYMPYKIQKKRSLVEKVSRWRPSFHYSLTLFPFSQLAALEKEVKERSQKDSQKEQQEADAPIINPGMIGNRLLITQGNGCVHIITRLGDLPNVFTVYRYPTQGPPPMTNGTGIPLGVPPVSAF